MLKSSNSPSTQIKYWSSIDDLPIYYYWKTASTGNLDHLIYEGSTAKLDSSYKKDLYAAWEEIELEMLEIQLSDPSYVRKLQDERRHYLKKVKAAITNNTLDKLHYQMSAEIWESIEENTPFNYERSIALMELHMGGAQINDKVMTTRRYYTHLMLMKETATMRRNRQRALEQNRKKHGAR